MGTPIQLTDRTLAKARRLLLHAARVLDKHQVRYHLEGGTLLGIVRDGDLLPWDHDLDISIPFSDLERFKACLSKLSSRHWIVRTRLGFHCGHPAMGSSQNRLFKVKNRVGLFFSGRMCLDIFVKHEHEGFVYWEAKEKLMRVGSRFYRSYEEVEYRGVKLKVPNDYRDYLSAKYGDWSVPVKEWDCALHEHTIVA